MKDPFQLQDPLRVVEDEQGRRELRERAARYRERGRVDDALDIYWRMSDWQPMADLLMELGRPIEAGTAWLRLLPFLPVRGDTLTRAEANAAREAARCYAEGGLHLAAAGLLVNLGEREAAAQALAAGELPDARAAVLAGEPLSGNPWPDGRISSRPPAGARDGAQTEERPLRGARQGGLDPSAQAAREESVGALDALVQVPVSDPHYLDVADLVARLAFQHGLMSVRIALFLDPLLSGKGIEGRQPEADTLYTLGRLHERIGFTEKASVAYAHALAIDPTHRAAAMRGARLTHPDMDLLEVVGDAFSLSLEMESSADDRASLVERVSTTTFEFNLGPLRTGSVIAERFRLTEPLGEGGCGVVFAATDTERDGEVALKILRTGAGELRAVTRFEREIAISRGLDHPNVVKTLDSGVWRELHWIAMERLDGIDLGVLLRRIGRPLPVRPALRVLREAAEGLDHAHERGVIHRDIKPSNIFVLRGTHHVKLLDFGLALAQNATRVTRVGTTLGSPRYMAPERLRGDERIGPWSDLYALGVVLYRMLTATMPFKEKDLPSLLQEIAEVTPLPPSSLNPNVPADLDALVEGMLAKDPDERTASASELLTALDPIQHRIEAEHGAPEEGSSAV